MKAFEEWLDEYSENIGEEIMMEGFSYKNVKDAFHAGLLAAAGLRESDAVLPPEVEAVIEAARKLLEDKYFMSQYGDSNFVHYVEALEESQ